VVVAQSDVLFQRLREGRKEHLSQDTRCPGRDSNLGFRPDQLDGGYEEADLLRTYVEYKFVSKFRLCSGVPFDHGAIP
jgi:hypothetical protein